MHLRTLAALAATSLLLSCTASATGTVAPGTGATTAPTTTTAPMAATVTIKAFAFNPTSISIKQGGIVTFINSDTAVHTITPVSGAAFTDSGNLAIGASIPITFSTVGTQSYKCAIHPSMTGTVVVTP